MTTFSCNLIGWRSDFCSFNVGAHMCVSLSHINMKYFCLITIHLNELGNSECVSVSMGTKTCFTFDSKSKYVADFCFIFIRTFVYISSRTENLLLNSLWLSQYPNSMRMPYPHKLRDAIISRWNCAISFFLFINVRFSVVVSANVFRARISNDRIVYFAWSPEHGRQKRIFGSTNINNMNIYNHPHTTVLFTSHRLPIFLETLL